MAIAQQVTATLAPGHKASLDGQLFAHLAGHLPRFCAWLSKRWSAREYVVLLIRCRLIASHREALRLIRNQGAWLSEQRIFPPSAFLHADDLVGSRFLLLVASKKEKIIVEVREVKSGWIFFSVTLKLQGI